MKGYSYFKWFLKDCLCENQNRPNNTHLGLLEHLQPLPVLVVRRYGGPHQQLVVGVLGGVGVLAGLFEVGAGDQRDELPLLVYDGQLPLLGLLQGLKRSHCHHFISVMLIRAEHNP